MKKGKMNSGVVMLISLMLGILVGIIVNACNAGSSPFMSMVSFVGTLYLNMLKMMVYPLIFCAAVSYTHLLGHLHVPPSWDHLQAKAACHAIYSFFAAHRATCPEKMPAH